MDVSGLTRDEMKFVLAQYRGTKAEIARELGITHAAVVLWLQSRCNSQRIEVAVRGRVQKLLAELGEN